MTTPLHHTTRVRATSCRTIPLLAACLLASSASAAPVPKAPQDDDALPPSAVRLLEHRKVQKELKMSPEQRIVILDGLADLDGEFKKQLERLSRMPNATDDQFDKLVRDHRKAIDKLLTDAAKKLTDAQRKRLRQLDWRVRGVAAFTDPRAEKFLQLTDAQKRTAAELAGRQRSELDRFLDGQIDGDEAKLRDDLFAVRAGTTRQMESKLTAEQKTAWAAMLGAEPTDFKVDELWLRAASESDQ